MTTTALTNEAPSTLQADHAADVASVVELALQVEGIQHDPAEVARSAGRLWSDLGSSRHVFVALAATCAEHGLSASAIRYTANEIIEHIDDGMTLVVDAGASELIVLSAPNGSATISCHRVSEGAARPIRRTARQLLKTLGGDLLNVLAIEARFPLDVLRNQGTGPSGAFRKLWALARMERNELTTVFIYAVFIGGLTLVVPVSVQALVNTIAFGAVLQPLVILGMALLAGLVLSAVLQTMRYYVVEFIQQRIFAKVVNDYGHRLPRWSLSAISERDPRELATRFFDVVTLQKAAATLSIDALGLTLQTLMGLLLLAFYHPILLAFDVVLVLALVALVWLPLRRGAATSIAESKAKYATAAWLQVIAEHRPLFANARGARFASGRAEKLCRAYLEKRTAHWRDLMKQIAGGLALHVVAAVALLLIGGWLVIERQLTIGQLVASELIVAVIGAGFTKLGKQMETIYDAAAAIDKVTQVVDAPRERAGGLQLRAEGPAQIELRDVTDLRMAGLVTASIQPGDTVAITGEQSCGKSTLLSLLGGHRTPSGGTVRVDGVDLERANLSRYRSRVCVIDESARAPDLTIAELLRLHAPHASTSALDEVIEAVGLTATIARLPHALDEKLLPDGAPLSRREMLRLSVARLLLMQPRLALIDGTLDALADDTALLDLVLGAPWTTLVTTNAPTVLSRAQRTFKLGREAA